MSRKKKVPVIMQMEALECGAACLAMVLASYGKWVPLEQVRADCGVSRDGSSAKNVVRAARSYGLQAQGYRYETQALKKNAVLPCILHWNFNHFVVLRGFTKRKALLNDPARGAVSVPMEEFDRSFTGICMQFSPAEGFVPDGKRHSVLAFARSRLKGTLLPFLFVVLTGLITSLIGIINPVFSRVFIDRILTAENPEWLSPMLIGMSALALVQIAVVLVQTVYMLKMEGKLAVVANASFLWHVLRLPMEFFSQRMAGDIAMRQQSNEGIASSLIKQLGPVLLHFAMLLFYLLVMLRYSPLLTGVGLLSVVVNMVVAQIISKKRINVTRVQMRDEGMLAGATAAGIEMIESIKASGAENGFFERWAGYQASVNSSTVKFLKLNQYLGMIPGLAQQAANLVVLVLGAMLVMEEQFTVGALLAFQGFMSSFLSPFQSILSVGQNLQEMRTSMERIEDVMHYPTDVEYNREGQPEQEGGYEKLTGRLEMKGVTFGYSKLFEPLLSDFHLTLMPGSSVAFVGASGCGKSTLAKLISGLYQPWSGEILFDGKPRSAIPREVLTGSLAVVDQDIILFENSVSDNIKMWDGSIEDFEMILAARDAHIHETIMTREGGYEYKILEGGKDFSGGQRQRLEIARVLAQDPTLLILDEATSALDAKTEYEVVKSIKERGITLIIVAHRLSTIRDCDEIIVLDQGKVAERGTHTQLYERGGLYTRLVASE